MTLLSEDKTAQTAAPILPVLAARWSPRSYVREAIDETKLTAALEAARWSASAGNTQPWRFIVARRGTEAFDKIAATLMGFNAEWAPNAGVLLVALAETTAPDGSPRPNAFYDLGQAMAHLSVQAHHDGLHVHQMMGFVGEELRTAFDIPESFVPFTVSTIGTLAPADELSEALAAREKQPRTRLALDELTLVNA